MRKQTGLLVVAALFIAFTFISSLHAQFDNDLGAQPIITNGSFELPGFSNIGDVSLLSDSDTNIQGWTVGLTYGRPIEWVKQPTYSVQQGDYALRMGPNADIVTLLNIFVEQTYRVSFWAAGGATQSYISASAGNGGGNFGLAANAPWQEFTFNFTGDPTLRFTAGGLTVETRTSLDNVTVELVPEPSTYALLLMTAAGALWFTRKRRPIKVRALIPVVAVLFAAVAAPNLHAQLIEARAYWRGGGSVPGFLDGGGVAFDADGNLFRTQINQDLAVREGLILKITPDGAYTSIPIPFLQPYSLALTDNGTVYAGSWSAGVAKISPNGNVTHISTEGNAHGMAADSNGNVWVGTGEKIFRISPDDDIEVFGSFFYDGANGMAIDEDGWLIFQTVTSYGHGARRALPDLALAPTTVLTGTTLTGHQQGFTFKGSVEPHLVSVVPNANSGDVGQRAFYTVPEPSTYALLVMTATGALWFARRRR